MKLSEELRWRGFINQTTYSDLSVLDDQEVTFYHGFDASADSQTVGNLAAMMLDRIFMKHGHKAVILAGGSTSLIGDPGGKDEERPLPDEATIANNVSNTEEQLKKIFTGFEFDLVNNLDWTRELTVIEYLRRYGKHFSMTPLIQRDYIAKRLGEGAAGISYAEFSYTVLQGMDYLHLFETKNVTLQLGGSDQWGNCLSGVELIRKVHSKEVHALTLPLVINKATGRKFGKSEEGAVWLDSNKTSSFHFYQFWVNVDDEGVEDYLKIYTELSKEEVDALMAEFNQDRASRKAQKTLAFEVTKIVHGEQKASDVEAASRVIFGDYSNITPEALAELKELLPVASAQVGKTRVLDTLVQSGLVSSNSEARRLIAEGAVYVNGEKVAEGQEYFDGSSSIHGHLVLQRGKSKSIIELTE